MARRLLFMDVAKGSAILGVILVHTLIYGVWFFPSNAIKAVPIWLMVVLSPLIIVSTWAGFFELMSGIANAYTMYNRLVVRKYPFRKAAQGTLVNSTGLLVIHVLFTTLLYHRRNAPYPRVYDGEINSLIVGSIELGRYHPTDFQFFFYSDVLGSIALAGYLIVGIMWVLHRFGGLENIQRSYKQLTIFAIFFFVISYAIWNVGYEVVQDLLIERSASSLVLAYPLARLVGAFQPFFPIAGFGIVGVVLGLLIAVQYHREEDPDHLRGQSVPSIQQYIKWVSPLSFLVFVGLLLAYILQADNPLGILDYYVLPPSFLALNISLMLLTIGLAIKVFEQPDLETRKKRAQQTLFIRRFAMVSLSVYVFECVTNAILSFSYVALLDDPLTPEYETHVMPIPIIIYVLIEYTMWFIIVWFWEKKQFKYSLEWWVIKIGSRFRSTRSQKINMDLLYFPLGKTDPLSAEERALAPEIM